MIPQEEAGDGPEGFVHGRKLIHNLRAVAFLFHHALQAAYLSFDAPQAEQHPALGFCSHLIRPAGRGVASPVAWHPLIPPRGMVPLAAQRLQTGRPPAGIQ
jgi:hypothetical protein